MPTPRLLHPVSIEIRQIDRKFTAIMDHNLHEPIGQVRRKLKSVKLRAQMKINRTDDPQSTAGSVIEKSTGYALFLTADLRNQKVTIDRGDRIVKIGVDPNSREVDYYIVKFEWRGHYPEHGGPTLLKAHFEDRHPSRQRGDL